MVAVDSVYCLSESET